MTIHTDTYIRLVNKDDFLLAEMEGFSDCLPIQRISFHHSVKGVPILRLVMDNISRYFKEIPDVEGALSYKGYEINCVRAYTISDDAESGPLVEIVVELPEPPFGDPREFFTRNDTNNTEV